MTRVSAGQKRLLGLGRYRFQERLSTCFFGPRFRITVDPDQASTSQPPAARSLSPGPASLLPAQSIYPTKLHPSSDARLAMRLVCAETQVEIERLARAVQSVRDLDHRAVLKPLQMVRSSTRLGVITPHIEGLTLSQLLANANMQGIPVPPAVTLRIAVDVLEGLEALRAHAVATRRPDWLFGGLTPDNVFIGDDGQSRLLDPGLTGAAARLAAFAHEPAALAYTAPELTSPEGQATAACDVFSLGVMLWELLTGQPLFAAGTAAQTLENLHRAPIGRVQRNQFVRGEPIAFSLAQTVANTLKRSAAQRLQDYDALMTALVQAGPIGRPEAVGELVKQCASPSADADAKELAARTLEPRPDDGPVTAPKITLRVSNKTQPGLAPPPALLPSIVPPTAATPEQPSSAPNAALPAHMRSRATTTRIRKLPSARPLALSPAQRPLEQPKPTDLRLRSDIIDQVSAFPIGDLRPQAQRRSSFVPMALAAATLLGLGAWSLRLLQSDGGVPASAPAAASAHAPQMPPPPAAPAPPAAELVAPPDAPAVPVAPAETGTPERPASPPAQAPASTPTARKPTTAGQPADKPRVRARSDSKPRSEPRRAEVAPNRERGADAKTPRVAELPPPEPEQQPEPEAAPGGVLKITPAPTPKPAEPDIPDDI